MPEVIPLVAVPESLSQFFHDTQGCWGVFDAAHCDLGLAIPETYTPDNVQQYAVRRIDRANVRAALFVYNHLSCDHANYEYACAISNSLNNMMAAHLPSVAALPHSA